MNRPRMPHGNVAIDQSMNQKNRHAGFGDGFFRRSPPHPQPVLPPSPYKGDLHQRIAAERKLLRKILESSASQASEVEKRMEAYTTRLESRLTQLPKELETGLDPPRIAKLLSEVCGSAFSGQACQIQAQPSPNPALN